MRSAILKLILIFALPASMLGQGIGWEANDSTAVLLDEFGLVGHCDLGARIDAFLVDLQENSTATGYVINYNGTNELPAYYGTSPRERMIANHIAFRRFDPLRITFVRGGYRNSVSTELWIVPPGAEPPEPSRTVPAPVMSESENFLFDRTYLESEYESDGIRDLILSSVLAERDSWESDQEDEDIDDEYIDSITPEEKEEFRFRWVSIVFGKVLAKRLDSSGVIIFYADDEYYDVGKLTGFIEEGVRRIEVSANAVIGRTKIVFGGFRSSPQVEYWVVPSGSSDPEPKPEERPPDTEACEDV